MALKFRLKGLAETFIDELTCPSCGHREQDDSMFSTEHTRVTPEGIIVVVQCKCCDEIFVPDAQRNGILDRDALVDAVQTDCKESGEPLFEDIYSVRLNVERLNAVRRNAVH